MRLTRSSPHPSLGTVINPWKISSKRIGSYSCFVCLPTSFLPSLSVSLFLSVSVSLSLLSLSVSSSLSLYLCVCLLCLSLSLPSFSVSSFPLSPSLYFCLSLFLSVSPASLCVSLCPSVSHFPERTLSFSENPQRTSSVLGNPGVHSFPSLRWGEAARRRPSALWFTIPTPKLELMAIIGNVIPYVGSRHQVSQSKFVFILIIKGKKGNPHPLSVLNHWR